MSDDGGDNDGVVMMTVIIMLMVVVVVVEVMVAPASNSALNASLKVFKGERFAHSSPFMA